MVVPSYYSEGSPNISLSSSATTAEDIVRKLQFFFTWRENSTFAALENFPFSLDAMAVSMDCVFLGHISMDSPNFSKALFLNELHLLSGAMFPQWTSLD
ncbi:hypothetical protein U1Q18_034416 [Sarracenia purpurea var. burkii]